MVDATSVKEQVVVSKPHSVERVPTMRLCDVLKLFIGADLRAGKHQKAMDDLCGVWGVCVACHTTIALAALVLWGGGGFVHAGHMKNGDAVPWDEVTFQGCKDSVAEKLRQKREEQEARGVA